MHSLVHQNILSSSPHRLHYFFLKRIPIAFIILSRQHFILIVMYLILEHTIATTNLIIINNRPKFLPKSVFVFTVNVFFPHRTPYLAQPGCFLLPLVGPCVFGTLLPTNPARVATALSQSTKVPPYLTLAGSLPSINTPRLHCRFAKHEQQFPLLFLGAAAAVGSIQRMFHPAIVVYVQRLSPL
jgi:hypothetical protein